MNRPVTARRVLAGWFAWLGLVALGVVAPARAAHFLVAGPADTVSVLPNATFTLEFVVREAGPAFNAFDLDVHFDPARLTNVPLAPLTAQRGTLMTSACLTSSPFHLFSSGAGALTCTVVILCSGVSVTGPGQLYRVNFTAAPGDAWTQVTFGPQTAFYLGGPTVDTLVTRPIAIRIGNPGVLGVSENPGASMRASLERLVPNPARSPRQVAMHLRLPREDTARWSLLDPQGRAVAGASLGRLEAGAQRIPLELPVLAPGRYSIVVRTGRGETLSRAWVVLH
jgi:hypothetical protein